MLWPLHSTVTVWSSLMSITFHLHIFLHFNTSTSRTCSPAAWHIPPTGRWQCEEKIDAICLSTCRLSVCYSWCKVGADKSSKLIKLKSAAGKSLSQNRLSSGHIVSLSNLQFIANPCIICLYFNSWTTTVHLFLYFFQYWTLVWMGAAVN